MELTDVKIKVPIGMRNYIDLEDEHDELQRNALILYPAIKNLTISHGRATGLDIGESEAIILSDQIKADLLLMDEVKGRQVARNM